MARFPFPTDEAKSRGITEQDWNAMCNSVFQNAAFPESLLKAWDLAASKGLDVFKGHIDIVAGSKTKIGNDWVETENIWLSFKSLIFTAHRTGYFAGVDPVQYGPMTQTTYSGKVYENQKYINSDLTIEHPEYAIATIYRLVQGVRCPFTEKLFFNEVVKISRQGMPSKMWAEKPMFMLGKNAKAAALRLGFSECEDGVDEIESQDSTSGAKILNYPSSNARSIESVSLDKPDDGKSSDSYTESVCKSFEQFSPGALNWLDQSFSTSIALGAFTAGKKNMQTVLHPDFQELAAELYDVGQVIFNSPKKKSLLDFIEKALNGDAAEFPRAVRYAEKQGKNGVVDEAVVDAIRFLFDFHTARVHAETQVA